MERVISFFNFNIFFSVNDNMLMILAAHNWLVFVMETHEIGFVECKCAAYLVLMCVQHATFQVRKITDLKIDMILGIKSRLMIFS